VRAWLLRAAIVASTAALLGTTEDDEGYFANYTFERRDIDGGFVELTHDQPSATFFISVHANALGPGGVKTTDAAEALIKGTVTSSGIAEGTAAPSVSVKVSAPEFGDPVDTLVIDDYSRPEGLKFVGDCANFKTGTGCVAHLLVEVSRQDNGDNGGIARFDWSFDVSSHGEGPAKQDGEIGPLDPPWTIGVSGP
jgi:hypothetical protein